MKKIFMVLSLVGVIAGCTSTQGQFKEITIKESETQYILEDVTTTEKPLEDIIVFNEEGVVIRKDGNNIRPHLRQFDHFLLRLCKRAERSRDSIPYINI